MGAICAAGGFEYRVEELPAGPHRGEATLLPLSTGGFLVIVDPQATGPISNEKIRRRRLRFRLAHEIGHSFFYDRRSRPPRRLIDRSKKEEEFCQQFASALLVPPDTAVNCPLDIASIQALRDRYDVSLNAVAWALVNTNSNLSIALLKWEDHPSQHDSAAMRVVWGAAANYYLPRRASVPASWLEQARQGGEEGTQIPNFRLGSLRARCEIRALPYRPGQTLLFIKEQGLGRDEERPNVHSQQLPLAPESG